MDNDVILGVTTNGSNPEGLYRCGASSSSGGVTETILWTNPSPTKDFAAQTVTMSQTWRNFDYIKIIYKRTKSIDDLLVAIFPVETISSEIYTSRGTGCTIGCRAASSSGSSHARNVQTVKTSDYDIYFSASIYLSSSTTGTNNANAIPYQIIGLKGTI